MPKPPDQRPVGLRTVFAHPAYRRLWVARTASQWGDVFAAVALALLVFDLTGSALGVSAVVLAEILPVLLLAPLAGSLVDRLPRVWVMVGADLMRAVLAIALVFLADDVVAIYVIAFGLSVGAVLFNPAANSTLPAIVDDDELIAANSGIWTAAVLSQIALAPLAGIAYAALGPGPAFAINAASFLVSAAVLVGLRLPAPPARTARHGVFADAVAGVKVLIGDRVLRALAAGQLLAALSAGATSALLVVLARDHLRLEPSGYGLLLGAIGIGAVLGPLVLTSLVTNPRRPAFVFGPYLLRGVVDVVLAAVTALPVALAALAVYGLGTSSGAVTFNSLLQSHTPEPVRGRVFASFDMLWQLGRLLSLLLGGALAAAIGIQAVYYLGGALLIAAAVIGWAGLRPPSGRARVGPR
ncbi:MFS transporter [Pseudonocardia sichuanensis]|uniref:Putative MFS family arabinose efflux permease n=1 Tax=Pseudonocardia kunmingensis TaxID=630975 RepID=A0A543D9S4_9PSEU|nr:MFS transporter [Pseudonocardia kunmingensis]TQM06094.1 putative MFS family arabinose efflux permease [Pseudonocardia kunmingensis]